MDLLKFLVDDLPLGVHDRLEVLHVADPDLGVLLLGFQLELYLEDDDLGVGEALGLLLEAGVGEGLLEGDPTHQEGVVDGASGDLLDADQVLVQEVGVQFLDCRDHYLCEEVFIAGEQLGVECSFGAPDEHVPPLLGRVLELDDEFVEGGEAELEGVLVSPDDDLGVHAVLDEALRVLEELPCDDGNCGGAEWGEAYPSPT